MAGGGACPRNSCSIVAPLEIHFDGCRNTLKKECVGLRRNVVVTLSLLLSTHCFGDCRFTPVQGDSTASDFQGDESVTSKAGKGWSARLGTASIHCGRVANPWGESPEE